MATFPEFLRKKAFVKARYWFGQIVDVCKSDERCMVLVASPNGLWRGRILEWVEWDEKSISPATKDDMLKHIALYRERIESMLAELQLMEEVVKQA